MRQHVQRLQWAVYTDLTTTSVTPPMWECELQQEKNHSVIAENLGLGGLTQQNNPNRILIENYLFHFIQIKVCWLQIEKKSTRQVLTVALRKLSLIQKLLLIFHLIDFTTILKCGNAGAIYWLHLNTICEREPLWQSANKTVIISWTVEAWQGYNLVDYRKSCPGEWWVGGDLANIISG